MAARREKLSEQYEQGIANLRKAGLALRSADANNREKQAQLRQIADEVAKLACRLVDLVGPEAEQKATADIAQAQALLAKTTGLFATVAESTGNPAHAKLAEDTNYLGTDVAGHASDEWNVDSALRACAVTRLETLTDAPLRFGGLSWAVDRIKDDTDDITGLIAQTDDLVQTALDDSF